MKKSMAIRLYKLTDAVLKQKADEFVTLLDRDQVEFAERGYDAAAKTAFTEAVEVINTISSDETLEAEKMMLTEKKLAARSTLEKSMRTVFNMAANKFEKEPAKYRSFGDAEISRKPDAELVRLYKVMVTAANENLSDLASEGLTQNKIDNITTQGIALDVAIDGLAKGISDRDMATENRIENLNYLYSLVSKYAGIGQDIFYEVNEAKYNDYVIYDTPSGMPEEGPIV